MKEKFDEMTFSEKEKEQTLYQKIKTFFGFPQPPRAHKSTRQSGMRGWCGNALGLDEREKIQINKMYPQVLEILETKGYITKKILIDNLNTYGILADDILLKLKAEERITHDGLKVFNR